MSLLSATSMLFTKDFLLLWGLGLVHFMSILLIMKQVRLFLWAWLTELGAMVFISGVVVGSEKFILMGLVIELLMLPLLFLSMLPVLSGGSSDSGVCYFLTLQKFPYLSFLVFLASKEWVLVLVLIFFVQSVALLFADKMLLLYGLSSVVTSLQIVFLGLKSVSLAWVLLVLYLFSSLLLLGLVSESSDLFIFVFLLWSPLTLSFFSKLFLGGSWALFSFVVVLVFVGFILFSVLFILSMSLKVSHKIFLVVYCLLFMFLVLWF